MTATGNESHIDKSVEVAARAAAPGAHPLLMSGDGGVQCHGASISTHYTHWPVWGGGHQDQGDTVHQCSHRSHFASCMTYNVCSFMSFK